MQIIKIKRSSTAASPVSLQGGELAYSEKAGSKILFIGTNNGADLEPIGGKDMYDKVAGIEAGATTDQTGAEIKTLYEAEANTNALTDTLLAKLNGIEAGATSDLTGAEIKALYEALNDTNAFTDAEKAKLANVTVGYLGFFADEAALISAHPTGSNGQHSSLGSTDSIWTWDADTSAWVDSGNTSTGDMTKATYDPTNKAADAFNMENMNEGATKLILQVAERAKLGGIAAGATANDTDANLKNRANHTGTQLAATISNFTAAVQAVNLDGGTF